VKAAVVGLGKLGACMAVAMSHKGLDVVGVDTDEAAVAAINDRRPRFHELQLSEMLASARTLRATSDHGEAIGQAEATFLVVPTPSEEGGEFSLRYVRSAAELIGAALANKSDYHLVVLTSTVLPGGTQAGLIDVLERSSGKRCGRDFGVCYSPEFIALGTVIRDFLNPELLLIGEHDERAGEALEQIYRAVLDNEPAVRRMKIVNAELTKVALNTFVTTKITFANMLAQMCETLPGGDVDAVTDALGHDSRIGPRYLSAGLGYGGPCFPRDNRALRVWGSRVGASALLAEATDDLNGRLGQRTLAGILSRCSPNSSVGILGLTYKPGSAVLDGSEALQLAEALAQTGLSVRAYDPLAEIIARDAVDGRIEIVASLSDALDGADVVVLATPDPLFAHLDASHFAGGTIVVDCWRLLRGALEGADGVVYVGLGLGPDGEEAADRPASDSTPGVAAAGR
jgi:UDPglucose 6-dehydrogenase